MYVCGGSRNRNQKFFRSFYAGTFFKIFGFNIHSFNRTNRSARPSRYLFLMRFSETPKCKIWKSWCVKIFVCAWSTWILNRSNTNGGPLRPPPGSVLVSISWNCYRNADRTRPILLPIPVMEWFPECRKTVNTWRAHVQYYCQSIGYWQYHWTCAACWMPENLQYFCQYVNTRWYWQ